MSKEKKSILLVVGVLTAAASVSMFATIYELRSVPFPWDSAGHASEGLIIARDLRAGDLISFLADTYRQAWWPFFHSWLLAPAFLIFGISPMVARSVSLVCFLIFLPVVFLVGSESSERGGSWTGVVVACLCLTSLPYLVLSCMCMSEIPGLLMTFLAFLAYLMAVRKKSGPLYSLAGILLALTLFTKSHHGVFAIFSVFVTQISMERKLLCRSNRYLLTPLLLMLLGWFAYPPHVVSFYGHATFQPEYFRMWTLENLLFYPRSFFQIYHASPVVAVMMSAALLASLRHVRDARIRLFLCHVVVGLVLMTIKLDNRHRYVITIVPSAWILAGSAMARIKSSSPAFLGGEKGRTAAALVVLLLLAGVVAVPVMEVYGKYPESIRKYNYWCDERANAAYEFISRKSSEDRHIAVFGSWDHYNSVKGATIRWVMEASRYDDEEAVREKKEKVQELFSRALRKRDAESVREFMRFLEQKDVRVDEYHILSFMKVLDEEKYLGIRDRVIVNPFNDKIVDPRILAPEVTSIVCLLKEDEEELNRYANAFMNESPEWAEYARERFEPLGITIRVFKRHGVGGGMKEGGKPPFVPRGEGERRMRAVGEMK